MILPAGFGMKFLKIPYCTFFLLILNTLGFNFFDPFVNNFNAANPNAWDALASLFFQSSLGQYFFVNTLILFLGSFLEQKVSGKFLVGLYVAGGLSGLLCLLPLMEGSNEVLIGSTSSVFALGGGTFMGFRRFRFRVHADRFLRLKISERLNRINGTWAVPGLLLGAETSRYFLGSSPIYAASHLASFILGMFLVWRYGQKQESSWPWISDAEFELYYQTKSLGFEQRFASLRTLALSNFSNPRTWSEWTRVALKYPNEKALTEISKHLVLQISEHSKVESGRRQWIDALNQKHSEKAVDSLIAKLEATDVLRLADWALQNRAVNFAFKILLSPAVRMDLHWIVNFWLRKIKQGQFSEDLTKDCFVELQNLAQNRELPQALQKFQTLLKPNDMPSVKKVA